MATNDGSGEAEGTKRPPPSAAVDPGNNLTSGTAIDGGSGVYSGTVWVWKKEQNWHRHPLLV